MKSRATQDVLDDNLHEETQIFVCDINPKMLNVGQKRALERGKVKGAIKLSLDEKMFPIEDCKWKWFSHKSSWFYL